MSISRRCSMGVFAPFAVSVMLTAISVAGSAQGLSQNTPSTDLTAINPPPAPPPPSFSKDHLIHIDMSGASGLKFSYDPATLAITPDGVVRVVMVATSATVSQALFEAIRCGTGEFMTHARTNSAGQWVAVKDPQWRPMNGNNTSKHALALAQQGLCQGRSIAANDSAQLINQLTNKMFKGNP